MFLEAGCAIESKPLPSFVESDCSAPISRWASEVARAGESKTAHIYWPELVWNDGVVMNRLYADLDIYCENGCAKTVEDTEMYAFYRATHYWSLEKVFDQLIVCDPNTQTDETITAERSIKRWFGEVESGAITYIYSPEACKLPGATKDTIKTECISIKVEPK